MNTQSELQRQEGKVSGGGKVSLRPGFGALLWPDTLPEGMEPSTTAGEGTASVA